MDSGVIYGLGKDFIFKDAVKFLQSKTSLPEAIYKQMDEEAKGKAFTVSGYTSLEVLNAFKDMLSKAIEEGMTKAQFQEEMNSFLENKGYAGMDPFKTDVIFRTNIQTAYNAGHYKSMTDPTTMKLRPYWKYVTAGDEHVREDHAVMDDRVYAADDPIWDIWYPPNGFRCRCSVISLSKSQFEKGGYILETKVPKNINLESGTAEPIFPDKGFSNNPAKVVWKPDLSGFPKELKEVFKEHEKMKSK